LRVRVGNVTFALDEKDALMIWQAPTFSLHSPITKERPQAGQPETYGISLAASKVLGILVFIKKVVCVSLELSVCQTLQCGSVRIM
jgi:hypothetical protein